MSSSAPVAADASASAAAPVGKVDAKAAAAKLEADIAAARELAKTVNTQAAVDALLQLEKTARLAEDGPGAKAAALAVVELLHAAREWDSLNEHIALLAKKRSQLKMVVQGVVRAAAGWVDGAPAEGGVRERLVDTLLSVTEGKIYVEIDRARLTRARAAAKEAAGDLDGAAELIQEVSVETFGAMAKTEKIDFILEQVRVCLARGDFVRARILSKKVAPRAFVVEEDDDEDGKKKKKGGASSKKKKSSDDAGEIGIEGTVIEAPVAGTPPLERLKLKYYSLLVAYHQHKGDYLEVCRCLRAAYDTPAVFSPKKKEEMTDEEAAVAASLMDVEGEAAAAAAAAAASTSSTAPSTVSEDDAALAESLLKQASWYAVLAPATSSDQRTLLEATAAEPALDAFPLYRKLLATFSGNEVVEWPAFEEMVSAEIRGPRAADVFAVSTEQGKARLEALQTRVTEHNVLSASRFYSRITLARLARLLGFFGADGAGEAEAHVARMVSDGAVRARIDRPAGVVKFLGPVGGGGGIGGVGGVAGAAPAAAAGVPISFAPDSPEELLNDWAGGIKGLLDVVERASASIAREAALHKVTLRGVV